MKSTKQVKDLSEVSLPYLFCPPVTIEGSVNTTRFNFQANTESEVTYEVYEVLRHSDYEKYLN